MSKPDMREFRERAERKQIHDRLRDALYSFKKYMYLQDQQLIDRFVEHMPKPNIEDHGVLPSTKCHLADEYRVLCNSKRDCLFGMIRMVILVWWMHQDRIVPRETIVRVCEVLEKLNDNYGNEKPTKCGIGYTFLDFYAFMSEKDEPKDTETNQ